MTQDWTMDDVAMLFDGGYAGIYDGWIAAELKDGRIVNRWDAADYPSRHARTEQFIAALKEEI